jgi:transposase
MPRRHRSHSTEFKRQVVAEYHAGETLHGLGRRHDLSRNLIRIWIEKAEAGALDEDAVAAELLADYEARIAALERLVGRQTLEIEFLKGAARSGPSRKSAPKSRRSLKMPDRFAARAAPKGGARCRGPVVGRPPVKSCCRWSRRSEVS